METTHGKTRNLRKKKLKEKTVHSEFESLARSERDSDTAVTRSVTRLQASKPKIVFLSL